MWMGESKPRRVYSANGVMTPCWNLRYACPMRVLLMASLDSTYTTLDLLACLSLHLLSLGLSIEMEAYIPNQNHLANTLTKHELVSWLCTMFFVIYFQFRHNRYQILTIVAVLIDLVSGKLDYGFIFLLSFGTFGYTWLSNQPRTLSVA